MSTVISDEQKGYLIKIIDNYLKLHKDTTNHLCNQPEKQYDKDGNIICNSDCEACTNDFYKKRRAGILKRAGLSEETK